MRLCSIVARDLECAVRWHAQMLGTLIITTSREGGPPTELFECNLGRDVTAIYVYIYIYIRTSSGNGGTNYPLLSTALYS